MSQSTELEQQELIKNTTSKTISRKTTKTTKKKTELNEVTTEAEVPSPDAEIVPKKRAVRKRATVKSTTENLKNEPAEAAEESPQKEESSTARKKTITKAKTAKTKSSPVKKEDLTETVKTAIKTEVKKSTRRKIKTQERELSLLSDTVLPKPISQESNETGEFSNSTEEKGKTVIPLTSPTPINGEKAVTGLDAAKERKGKRQIKKESSESPASSQKNISNIPQAEASKKIKPEPALVIAETDTKGASASLVKENNFTISDNSFTEPEDVYNKNSLSMETMSGNKEAQEDFFNIIETSKAQSISESNDYDFNSIPNLEDKQIREENELSASNDTSIGNYIFEEFESELPEFEKFNRISRKKDRRIKKETLTGKSISTKRQKRIVPTSSPKATQKRKQKENTRQNSFPAGNPFLLDPYTNEFTMVPYSMEMPFQGKMTRPQKVKKSLNPIPKLSHDFDFNAAMMNDSVLGTVFHKEDENIPEEDGPQPILPNQPDAFSMGSEQEEDFEALDDTINGNTIKGYSRISRAKELHLKRKAKATKKTLKNIEPSEKETQESIIDSEIPPVRRVMLVSSVPDEQVEVAITENGQVAEYFIDMVHQEKIRGNIYKGVISNIDTNLQAAFVNFGVGKNGFLQIDEVHPEYYMCNADSALKSKFPPIQKALHLGQELLVQVVKEPAGAKGAFLTTWVSIAGRYLVLTPGQEQIGVSRKVEDPEERGRLKSLMNGIQPGENMGVIIRTASEGASQTNIQQDLEFLKKLWEDIRNKATIASSPSLIYQEADLISRTIRDYVSESFAEIWTDDEDVKRRIDELINIMYPNKSKEIVKLYKEQKQSLWDKFGLNRELETITNHEVYLPSGGRLVFDQTEALMAIDINSGRTQAKSNFESMVYKTNMEAVEAIARHLRLRDIGGQVVIDFIEMKDKSHCRDIEKALHLAMKRDRARHDIGHMSTFGLLELVRQRTGTSAISISCEPCPYCNGTGMRRNLEWRSLQVMRDMKMRLCKLHEVLKKKSVCGTEPPVFFYETEADLALYVLNRKRDRLAELEEKFGLHIEIKQK